MSMKGVYVLILRLDNDTCIHAGKLGELHLDRGFYAYVGSAHGTGGFRRVMRHFDVASGKNRTRRWHIDYLLPRSEVVCAVLLKTSEALECTVAQALGRILEKIPGFGCTDCSCKTHLFYSGAGPEKRIINACNELAGNESIIISPHM